MTPQEESSTPARDLVVAQAEGLINTGDPAAAAQLLDGHLGEHPDDVVAWSLLAAARLATDDASGALAAADSALAIDPDHLPTLLRRNHALRALDRPEASLVPARRAVELAPDDWDAQYALGHSLTAIPHRRRDALSTALLVAELGPDRADSYVLLGIAQRNLRLVVGASQSLQHALEIDPEHSVAQAKFREINPQRMFFPRTYAGFVRAACDAPGESFLRRAAGASAVTGLLRQLHSVSTVSIVIVWVLFFEILFVPDPSTGVLLLPGQMWVSIAFYLLVFVSAPIVIVAVNLARFDRRMRRAQLRAFGRGTMRSASGGLLVAAVVSTNLLLAGGLVGAGFSRSVSLILLSTATAALIVLSAGNYLVAHRSGRPSTAGA